MDGRTRRRVENLLFWLQHDGCWMKIGCGGQLLQTGGQIGPEHGLHEHPLLLFGTWTTVTCGPQLFPEHPQLFPEHPQFPPKHGGGGRKIGPPHPPPKH